jgi:uncharacterized protein with von Willebrand factor type A (vWA) domain
MEETADVRIGNSHYDKLFVKFAYYFKGNEKIKLMPQITIQYDYFYISCGIF